MDSTDGWQIIMPNVYYVRKMELLLEYKQKMNLRSNTKLGSGPWQVMVNPKSGPTQNHDFGPEWQGSQLTQPMDTDYSYEARHESWKYEQLAQNSYPGGTVVQLSKMQRHKEWRSLERKSHINRKKTSNFDDPIPPTLKKKILDDSWLHPYSILKS